MNYLKKLTFLIILFIFISQFIYSEDKSSQSSGLDASVININNWELWVKKDGSFPAVGKNGAAGNYPKEVNAIYASGLLWGARVQDGADTTIRVNGNTYTSGLKAGKVLFDISGKVIGSENPDDCQLWRIRRDYRTANLTMDAASTFMKEAYQVTSTDIQQIYDQYHYDWQNWPVDKGAPFEDIDVDGSYNPNIDIPGHPDALQTIWTVSNDLPFEGGEQVSYNLHGSPPIGIEQQMTVWSTNTPQEIAVEQTVFVEYKIIYTGLLETPKDAKIDTMYFTQWADPDLGVYTDDKIGFDSTLVLGYVYNGQENDETYDKFGLKPPSVGYTFVKMPTRNHDKVRLSSFFGLLLYHPDSDPDPQSYSYSLALFNIMEGFAPHPIYPERAKIIDPTTGKPTKITHYGDPLTGTGWVDTTHGDRQFWMSCGPFSMTLTDTQEVAVVLIGGNISSYLINITDLKFNTAKIRFAYQDFMVSTEDKMAMPTAFFLSQNYPNPFNPITTIHYELPEMSHVEISLYNILGEKISTLMNEVQETGVKEVTWNGTDDSGRTVSAGIYIYQLRAGEFIESRKMVLIR